MSTPPSPGMPGAADARSPLKASPPDKRGGGARVALPTIADAHEFPSDRSAVHLELFMGTRLGVATLLLGGALLIVTEDGRGFDAFTPRLLVSLIGSLYAASLVFALWLRLAPDRGRVALAQVCADLVLTTGLVYVTGGPSSGFTFLYGVAVLMAAMVVGPLAARVTGAIAIAMYVSLAGGLASRVIVPPLDQRPEAYLLSRSELFYVGLLNVSGLLLVTLLAGNLAARLLSAGGQLRVATASAARLVRLNDDIVRSLSSGLVSTDLRGNIRSINPTGIEMLGARVDALLGQSAASVLGIDLELLSGPNRPPGGAVMRSEGVATRADGVAFPVGFSVNSLVSGDGTSIGSLILFQDLSEITRLREVAAREERLAVLGRLSAGLAHEIRNPLSSISGSVQLVRDSPQLTAEERRLLEIVLAEVERLDDLVTTMVQVGRPRQPQRETCDLRPMVEAIVEMARRGHANVQAMHIEPSLPSEPVLAFVDGDQVRQVLWNLIKNALQASPPGGVVRVTLNARAEHAVLAVSDEGQGISPSQRDKVYNMFYSERTHGAGIGLALVRQIVDAHGGTIEIESEEQKGATFVVRFPRNAPRRGSAGRLALPELARK